jgi:hypothetical protein
MKTKILLLLVSVSSFVSAQDTIPFPKIDSIKTHSQVFSLSPISKKVDKVNGLVFGVGHYQNKHIEKQTINGVNVDLNPVGLAIPMIIVFIPEMIQKGSFLKEVKSDTIVKVDIKFPRIQINGLHLGTGCFFTNVSMNGLNISLLNRFTKMNGVSISPIGTQAKVMNGFSFGIYNGFNENNGLSIGLVNESMNLKGIQFGIYNFANTVKGIQIGIFNTSKKNGFQIGIWNVNNKRSMPFINW